MKHHIVIKNGDIIASFEHEQDRDTCIEALREDYNDLENDYFTAVSDKE